MPYESTVYRILIASPSDVDEEREVVSRIIQDWNDLNSYNKKIVLLPVKWETHSVPSYGIRPQEAINKQIVDECDLLVGFFWTKVGTPTGEDLSGTIEEIRRVSAAGKPVMLYFSKRGKDPSQIDLQQLDSLNKFKEETYKIALVENYNSIVDFRDKLSRQLEMKIRELQEKKISSKDLINFSFIEQTTGKLIGKTLEIDFDIIEATEKKFNDFAKLDSRFNSNPHYNSKHYLSAYIYKKNNIPIVLGIQNNSNRVFGNINAEIKLKCNKKDIFIQTINALDQDAIYNRLDNFHLSKENEKNLKRIFRSNLIQILPDTWEQNFKPFTILPNKIKILDSIIMLYPKDNIEVSFKINMLSDNILQPISDTCTLRVNVKRRNITKEEVTEIIDRIQEDDDDLPF
ncbi:hypothetical protein [Chryseobacterium sp.]|uniref:hypothetical protein n=1 Tax=Chryseobacterium sp. TaxID=1871047 RepID=UPI000EEEDB13|nr:hypothetical protein [Chryseobacterium sp.]HCA09875.1 hypothetical protein [Chryseobacterium sp.]